MNTTETKAPSITPSKPGEVLKNDLLTLPELIHVKETDSDTTVTEQDLLQINTFLHAIHQALPQIRSVDSLCKLAMTATKLIDQRRKSLKLRSGADSTNHPSNQGNRTIDMV